MCLLLTEDDVMAKKVKQFYLRGKLRTSDANLLEHEINQEFGLGNIFSSAWNGNRFEMHFDVSLPDDWRLDPYSIPEPYAFLILGDCPLYRPWPSFGLFANTSLCNEDFIEFFKKNNKLAKGNRIKDIQWSYANGITLSILFW